MPRTYTRASHQYHCGEIADKGGHHGLQKVDGERSMTCSHQWYSLKSPLGGGYSELKGTIRTELQKMARDQMELP